MNVKPVPFMHLEHLACRGPLERGRRYLFVHTMRTSDYYADKPSASWALTLSGIVSRSPAQTARYLTQTEKGPKFLVRTDRFGTNDWRYAADFGLWGVPGIEYVNHTNFVLDPLALLRTHGIRVTDEVC